MIHITESTMESSLPIVPEGKILNLNDEIEEIHSKSSNIGKVAVLFNKDDLPAFMIDTTINGDNPFGEYNYESGLPFITQAVAYAIGVKTLVYTIDDDGVQWIHDPYHNIVFDENGRQIGHFIYKGRNSQTVIMYQKPIRPQICDFLDEDEYDFTDYDPPIIPKENSFSVELKSVLTKYNIIDTKYTYDVDDNEWIYSKFNNIIFDVIGRQIGHMIFPYSLSDVGQAVIYKSPIEPRPNMI